MPDLCQRELLGPCDHCGTEEPPGPEMDTNHRFTRGHSFEPPRCGHPESEHARDNGIDTIDYCISCGHGHPFALEPVAVEEG